MASAKKETTDGLPPGAHAPDNLFTGGITPPPAGGPTPAAPLVNEGHVEDPTATPAEQAEKLAAKRAEEEGRAYARLEADEALGPVPKDHTRVRVLSNLTVRGRNYLPGAFVDVKSETVDKLVHNKLVERALWRSTSPRPT
jgi:hypothetical protein